MAQLTNNTPINAPITPGNDSRNTFATHYAKYGAGGLQVVATTVERNNIDAQRKSNKIVYNQETSKFEYWNNTSWVEVSIGNASIPQDVLDKIQKNTDNIARLKTIIGNNESDVFMYRGKVAPTYPSTAKKSYYLSFYALSGRLVLQMPTGNIAQGSLVLITNEDATDSIRVMNDGTIESNLPARNMALLVKTNSASDTNPTWDNVFAGFIPASLTTLMSTIKSNLPSGSTSSLQEIEAALKDKLHTFREIQTEFADQLHTITDLDNDGFIKGIEISDGTTNVPQVKRVKFSNSTVTTDSEGSVVTIKGDGIGIAITDGVNNVSGVEKIHVEGMDVESVSPTEAKLKTNIELMSLNHAGNPTQYSGQGHTIELNTPLQAYPVAGAEDTVRLEIKQGSYEKARIPGFLAYIEETEAIVPRETDPNKYHKGALFFGNTVKDAGGFIEIDRNKKAYGIQEFDGLDPNVSGGNDYLVVFRAAFIGTAPSDGKIRVGLIKKDAQHTDADLGYLSDKEGNPIVYERAYKQGQHLGVLEAAAFINTTGLKEFKCVVVESFTTGEVRLGDRANGGTGLMIQCLTSHYKTGDALQQFELDTQQNLEYSSYYLGPNVLDIKAGLTHNIPEQALAAGAIEKFGNFHLKAIKALKYGQGNNHLNLIDDGAATMFSFNGVIGSEMSHMLKNRSAQFSMSMTNDNSDFKAYICKFEGHPENANSPIISGINVDGTPIFEAGWSEVDSFLINQTELGADTTTSKTIALPSNPAINNFGFAIKPVFEAFPLQVEIGDMNVSCLDYSTGYYLKLPELVEEAHLKYNKEYKEFIQDNQKVYELRYTLNNAGVDGLAMPCGIPKRGSADVVLDTTVNQIPGSSASGGEGGVKFLESGIAEIATDLRIWSEQSEDTTATFWWEIYNFGLDNYKIPESQTTFQIKANSKQVLYSMPTFSMDVSSDMIIMLRGNASKADGAFLASISPDKPLVTTKVTFKTVPGISDTTGIVFQEDFNTNDFAISEDNKITIKEMQNIQNRLDGIDMELTITDEAKSAGWYIELGVNPSTGIPSLSPKQRSNT